MEITARWELGHVVAREDSEQHLLLTVTMPHDTDESPPSTALAVAIDRSQPDSDDHLDAAVRASSAMLAERRDSDVLLLSVGSSGPTRIRRRPDNLFVPTAAASRPDALFDAWAEALRTMSENDAAVRRVVLLSDRPGDERNRMHLVACAASAAAAGISTSTVALGEHADTALLRDIATAGRGTASHARHAHEVEAVLAAEQRALRDTAARDLTIELLPLWQLQILGVLGDLAVERNGASLRIPLGDLSLGQSRSVLLRTRIAGRDLLGPRTVGDVALRWRDVAHPARSHRLAQPLSIPTVPPNTGGRPDPEVIALLRSAEKVIPIERARGPQARLAS